MAEDQVALDNTQRQTPIALFCVIAFLFCMGLTIWWTVIPFVLRAFGGNKFHVGLAPALNMALYMVLLLAAYGLCRLDCRKATRRATVFTLISALLGWLISYHSLPAPGQVDAFRIWGSLILFTLPGAARAFFWPYLMHWVTANYEGRTLNRRLGIYNGGWALAVILAPLLGGALVQASPAAAMFACMTCFVLCLLLMQRAQADSPHNLELSQNRQVEASVANTERRLRWSARAAMAANWYGFAVLRTQFALVLTEDFGYSKATFGILLGMLSMANFAALAVCARWPFWQGRAWVMWVCSGLTAVVMLMLIYGKTLVVFGVAAVLLGLILGATYYVHLYYSARNQSQGSSPMVTHEFMIASSTVVGAFVGGYLAEQYGLYGPYWFVVGIVALALVWQVGLWRKGMIVSTQG